MIQHYLKVAGRQIAHNKTQYILSVVSIAIGMLCFSMTTYYIRKHNNQYTCWPHSDRIAHFYVTGINGGRELPYIPGQELQQLLVKPVAGIDQITYYEGYTQANITVCPEKGTELPFQCSFCNINPAFITLFSLETPEGKTPSLRSGEVLVSQSGARRLFGTANPVGKKLYFSQPESDKSDVQYATVAAVIRDLPEGTEQQYDLYFNQSQPVNPHREYWKTATALLAPGVSVSEVNKRLAQEIKPFGENQQNKLILRTLAQERMAPENLMLLILIPVIGGLVLLAAMINFLKFCIHSFYNRTRELSLRKSLGSGPGGLFGLLFGEVSLLFTAASLLVLMLTELLVPIYYQALPEHIQSLPLAWVHIPTLLWQQIGYLLALYGVTAAICAIAIYRIKKINLIQGIRAGKNTKHGFRNAMLGIQIFICVLFIGGTIGLNVIHHHFLQIHYKTLSDTECNRIWQLHLWEPQLQGYEKEVVEQIEQLAGVEAILLDDGTERVSYETREGNKIQGKLYRRSGNYADFMKLPVEGRMPRTQQEIMVSRSLLWILEKEGAATGSVRLGKKSYQITGVYEQYPFQPLLTREQTEQYAAPNEENRFSAITVPATFHYQQFSVKCVTGQEKAVGKKIEAIVRERLPESLPFEMLTFREEQAQQEGGLPLLSQLFGLLSAVSLLITTLGIYSAIALDTQSRQKEVAIRKINGADPKVIAMLFGKLYIRLLLAAMIPGLLLVFVALSASLPPVYHRWVYHPLIWLGTIAVSTGVIAVTVLYHIRRISRLNPADVIKSE